MGRATRLIDLQTLGCYPPCTIRMMAREVVRRGAAPKVLALTNKQIAERSGLTVRKVAWISSQPDWSQIRILDAVMFLSGCGLESEPPWKMRWFVTRNADKWPDMKFLEQLPTRERKAICRNWEKMKNARIRQSLIEKGL